MMTKAPNTPDQDMFRIDIDLSASPAARRAMQAGLLQAKTEAMNRAAGLVRWGRPLLIAIIAVSFLHLWDTIALIRPEWVQELRLPPWLYYTTAAALTLAIDAAALYCVAASGAAALAGAPPARRWGIWFFLSLTFLLNAAFVVRYAPALSSSVRAWVLPALDILFALLLPAFIPVAILSVEQATTRAEVARLKLLVETTALAELTRIERKPEKAPPTVSGPPPEAGAGQGDPTSAGDPARSPGRPSFDLTHLRDRFAAGVELRRADVITALGCGETTADRLVAEGLGAGVLARLRRGVYRRV